MKLKGNDQMTKLLNAGLYKKPLYLQLTPTGQVVAVHTSQREAKRYANAGASQPVFTVLVAGEYPY